jgi:hypothetical protein
MDISKLPFDRCMHIQPTPKAVGKAKKATRTDVYIYSNNSK